MKNRFYDLAVACDYIGIIGWLDDLVGCLEFIGCFQGLLKHPPFESEGDYNARF